MEPPTTPEPVGLKDFEEVSLTIETKNQTVETKKEEPIILDYIVHFNDPQTNHPPGIKNFFFPKFKSNHIRTTKVFYFHFFKIKKYTWWNFIPKNLFEQFSRISNFYFIMVMIFALLPNVSPIFPITSILPVIFILGTTLIKDGVEDFFRALSDRVVNRKRYIVVRNGKEEKVHSADLKVGDVIKIFNEQMFPCDLFFIASENDTGECFVSTVNLNGESNLKLHHSKEITKHLKTPELISSIKGKVFCEQPRFELEKFNGKLDIEVNDRELTQLDLTTGGVLGGGSGSNTDPLDHKNILLRGAILRNTKWVIVLILLIVLDLWFGIICRKANKTFIEC
jgi:magnesium-transporting ATPase (P-type)